MSNPQMLVPFYTLLETWVGHNIDPQDRSATNAQGVRPLIEFMLQRPGIARSELTEQDDLRCRQALQEQFPWLAEVEWSDEDFKDVTTGVEWLMQQEERFVRGNLHTRLTVTAIESVSVAG
jgi:hypothetical protein